MSISVTKVIFCLVFSFDGRNKMMLLVKKIRNSAYLE